MRWSHLSTSVRLAIAAACGAPLIPVVMPLLGATATSCGTDAIGIEACRQIETARCEAMPACDDPKDDKKPKFDVTSCTRFYADECLVGIENIDGGAPTDSQITACVAAIKATAECRKKGIATMAECTAAPLANPSLSGGNTPCTVLSNSPELLRDCAFVARPTAPAEAGVVEDAGDAGELDADAGGD